MVACAILSVELHKTKCVLPSPINTDCAATKYLIVGHSLQSSCVLQGGPGGKITS